MISKPKEALSFLSAQNPKLWPLVEKCIVDKFVNKSKSWPDWCFLPVQYFLDYLCIVSQEDGADLNDPEVEDDIREMSHRMSSVATWRYSQSIYEFDEQLYKTLITMPLDKKLPSSVFYNLPEWCVYIKTPKYMLFDGELDGFFASLQYNQNGGAEKLYLTCLHKEDDEISFISIPLEEFSLKEAIQAARNSKEPTRAHEESLKVINNKTDKELVDITAPLLCLVLYLCSEKPDIDLEKCTKVKPVNFPLTKTRKGFRLFAAIKERTWNVGKAIGDTIREGRLRAKGGSISPHLRRAHWHGYWTGPRDKEQVFKYNWIPPVFIEGNKIGLEDAHLATHQNRL